MIPYAKIIRYLPSVKVVYILSKKGTTIKSENISQCKLYRPPTRKKLVKSNDFENDAILNVNIIHTGT